MIAALEAPRAFLRARRMARSGFSRAAFEAWQAKALRRWLDHALPKVSAYGHAPTELGDLPILDKATLMAGFERYNQPGLSADEIWPAVEGDRQIGPYSVGCSTGTSGNRGLFIISPAERFRWLGTILAKALGDVIWQRHRVAILLPRNTALYRGAGRLSLRFYDLAEGPEAWRADLERFDPTVIVAPPKILSHLAQTGAALRPQRVFSAAETLDPQDVPGIEAAFGTRLGQIYMATEGLFAVSCPSGGLHLAEESTFFEFEPVAGHDDLVTPLVTCFARETQILARYRMNDLLRLGPPCPCGSPLRTVAEIVGRMDDILHLPGGMVTPDILRNAVVGADRRIEDYRIRQIARDHVRLTLPPDLPGDVARAAGAALMPLLAKRGARLDIRQSALSLPLDRKRRRVIGLSPEAPA